VKDWLPWIVLPAAVVAVAVVIARGLVRRDCFSGLADRDAGIIAIDLLFTMCCFVLGGLLTQVILGATGWTKPLSQGQHASAVLLGQMAMGVPIVVLLWFRFNGRDGGWRGFGFNVGPWPLVLRQTAGALVFGMLVVLAINYAIVWIGELRGYPKPPDGHALLKSIRDAAEPMTRYKLLISAVVVAPILEEVIYRGLVQTSLLDIVGPKRRWTVILITATLFTSVHIGIAQWQTLPGLMIFGVVLGWLYEKTGSLLPSILTHMAFNAAMISLMFLMT